MNQSVMTLAELKQLLSKPTKEIDDDFEIWLSSGEEGNEFLPMLKDVELCLAIEKDERKIIFYPAHR